MVLHLHFNACSATAFVSPEKHSAEVVCRQLLGYREKKNKKNTTQTQQNTRDTQEQLQGAAATAWLLFKCPLTKKKKLQRYERGNENFTSGESYRKSNKVCLQVRRTEWNITPHNQRLPDQYSSHRRDRLPGFVLLPSVCLSKRGENWNPCSWSHCAHLISRMPYGRVALAAGGFASPPQPSSHVQVIKSARLRGVSQTFPLLSLGDLMMMTVSVKLECHGPAVTSVKSATWISERNTRKDILPTNANKYHLMSIFPSLLDCFLPSSDVFRKPRVQHGKKKQEDLQNSFFRQIADFCQHYVVIQKFSALTDYLQGSWHLCLWSQLKCPQLWLHILRQDCPALLARVW